MRARVLILGLICLFIFVSCDKGIKNPHSTNPSEILNPPTIEYFTANPTQILFSESSTLSWHVTNATTITIDQGIGTIVAADTMEVSPEETTIYTLVASNSDGSVNASVQVEVVAPANFDFRASLEMTCPPAPYNTIGWVRSEGWIENTGGVAGENVVLHIPLLNIWGWEYYHLQYLVSPHVEPGERVSFNHTWTVLWEIYVQIDVGPTHQSIYVTWDNN